MSFDKMDNSGKGSAKYPFDEVSIRQNVLLSKLPYGEMVSAK
jgi:hypothetical protein